MSERVSIEIRDGVADVRLNRPDKMNALDDAMFRGILDAGERLRGDAQVRAVVLSGAGRAFCAGLDFSSFSAMAGDSQAPKDTGESRAPRGLLSPTDHVGNRAQYTCWVWQDLPMPVIAAVHGVAYGGGLQLALGADIRIVAPDARLSVREIHWGLVPDMAGTQTLRHLVRLDIAKELAFTGRIVSGSEAAELGLATQISESPHDAALEIAREIAGRSPHAVRATKQLFNATRIGSVEDGFKLEERLQTSLIGSPNQIEAVQANLQKRQPDFKDPE